MIVSRGNPARTSHVSLAAWDVDVIWWKIAVIMKDRTQQNSWANAMEIWLSEPKKDRSGVCISLIYNGMMAAKIPKHAP
jgi:hypothetical protein